MPRAITNTEGVKGSRVSKDDARLVKALRSGDPDARQRFVHMTQDAVYSSAALVFPEEEVEGRALDLYRRLTLDNFHALAAYDGRASLNAFVSLLLADLLADQIAGLFATDSERAWGAFEGFYKPDIWRLIKRRFPDHALKDGAFADDGHDDIYQEVLLRLVEDDYRRLRAYKGEGSFSGYVRRLVRNLCEDQARRLSGRRRLPKAVAAFDDLEQAVYKELVWHRTRREDLAQKLHLVDGKEMPDRLAAALQRVEAIMAKRKGDGGAGRAASALSLDDQKGAGAAIARGLEDSAPNPEEALIGLEAKDNLERAVEFLMAAMAALPEEGRAYLTLRFLEDPPLKPKQIAPILGMPVKEIYRQRSHWEKQLFSELRVRGIEVFPGLSV